MGLVDYSSGSAASSSDAESVHSQPDGATIPPAKKRKTDGADGDGLDSADSSRERRVDAGGLSSRGSKGDTNGKQPATALPPLPDTFHDLYASSVRYSVSDDPSLHQGRKRTTPHVVGNWPSHVYVEWHPSNNEHALLVNLVNDVQAQLGSEHVLQSFLTSDLGAPLPLHISLSRPLMLTTAVKDAFLSALSASLRSINLSSATKRIGSSAITSRSLAVSPSGLAFFRSPDSDRTFLVLRVANTVYKDGISSNPQLRELLRRTNAVATSHGLPTLYGRAIDEEAAELVDNAFHISIAWTFRLPDEATVIQTYKIFRSEKFKELRRCKVPVAGVKVKIGNAVTHVSLMEGRGGSGSPASGTGSLRSSRTPMSSASGNDSPWA